MDDEEDKEVTMWVSLVEHHFVIPVLRQVHVQEHLADMCAPGLGCACKAVEVTLDEVEAMWKRVCEALDAISWWSHP